MKILCLKQLLKRIYSSTSVLSFVSFFLWYRMNPNNPEKAKHLYSNFPCLQAPDIADAVIYALSAPAHVDVNEVYMRAVEQSL